MSASGVGSNLTKFQHQMPGLQTSHQMPGRQTFIARLRWYRVEGVEETPSTALRGGAIQQLST